MADLRISKTVAVWLIKVCTKIMRDATNSQWSPIQTIQTVYRSGCFAYLYRDENNPMYGSWIDAMLSVIKILSCSLSFQIEPGELRDYLLEENIANAHNPMGVLDVSSITGAFDEFREDIE